MALRVIRVAQDPKSSASDLAMVLAADPGLSATLLRVVNSAAYRRTREITSVQEALVLLGFIQARNIAISSAITAHYRPDSLNALFRIDAFWRHSLAVAFRAAELAGRMRVDVPGAFTAGVLHNMGRLAMFFGDPAGMDQAVAEAMRRDAALDDVEEELLGIDHGEVGRLLAERWRLPLETREAIAGHHGRGGREPREGSLAALVAEADRYCVGLGLLPGYVVPGRAAAGADAAGLALLNQVGRLMQLVSGEPVGVRG
ncbi:MAG: HDOD domain-containing protein [Dehalococcoidia bacterium]|nr:HDOD domain-containing protein [Dehalococcoidia bacterium]